MVCVTKQNRIFVRVIYSPIGIESSKKSQLPFLGVSLFLVLGRPLLVGVPMIGASSSVVSSGVSALSACSKSKISFPIVFCLLWYYSIATTYL